MIGGIQNTSAESAIQIAGSPLLSRSSWEQNSSALSEQYTSPVELCQCSFGVGRNPPEKSRNLQNIVLTFLDGFL
jgi:hypothetical protein